MFFLFPAPVIEVHPVSTSVPINSIATFSCVVRARENNSVVVFWAGPVSSLGGNRTTTIDGDLVTSTLAFAVTNYRYDGYYIYTLSHYHGCYSLVQSSPAFYNIVGEFALCVCLVVREN